jgi:hypothetical protein
MNAFAADPFAPEAFSSVVLDLYTPDYRVSGTVATRFSRVSDILNQLSGSHVKLDQATISEYDDPSGTLAAQQVHVALDEVLLCVAGTTGEARAEMRIPKRAVKAQIAIPPFRLTGTVHIAQGSRPADGLLTASDRFLAMTEVAITCAAHPELGRSAPAVAVQRRRAQVILVADDERPDELLAEVLDERTAQGWLGSREPPSQG